MDYTKIWHKILQHLANQLTPTAVKIWFAQCGIEEIKTENDKDVVVVNCANNFALEQIRVKYFKQLEEAFETVTQKKCQLVLKASLPKNKPSPPPGPLFSPTPSLIKTRQGHNGGSDYLNPNHNFANFIVGNSNHLAYAAAKAVVADPGKSYNPLFIYGGVGVGKTHLMQAIGNEILEKTDLKVVYTTCERFTNEFIESLSTHKVYQFRNKYRLVDVLLIDDVQFLSGKESTQEEFFHTFNELHVAQKQIVITSDKHPTEIGRLEDRLVSRFLGGLTVDIGQPDFEMRVAILKAKCAQRGIQLKDEVVDFIAARVIANPRELEGALIKLISAGAVLGKNLTIELAKEVFATNTGKPIKKVSGKQVVSIVAKHFNLKPTDLTGPKRLAKLVKPRHLAMYLLRAELGLGLVEVGQLLGNRDHTTIMHGVEKIARQLDNDRELRKELITIKQTLLDE